MVTFYTLVLVAATGAGQVTLLDFTGPNCVHCRNMEPTLKRLKDAGYPIQEIDVSRSPAWAQKYRVQGIPAFIMIANGQVVDRVDGATSHERLVRMFETAGFNPVAATDETIRSQSPSNRVLGIPLPDFLKGRKDGGNEPPPSQPPFDASRSSSFTAASEPSTAAPRSPSAPRPSAAPASRAAETAISPEQLAGRATVRLKVEDPQGYSFGTGTIIDVHNDEALILTCGHIFRDSQGQGVITVDLFADGVPRSVPGQLISYDSENTDLGLVSVRPGREITPIRVAPANFRLEPRMRVFTIGCNNGRPPTLQRSHVSAIDRYEGPSNIEVAGMPVSGRSGGGLFTTNGLLIGVCNAADHHDNEGIYASLPIIQDALSKIGQARVFEPSSTRVASNERPRSPGDGKASAAASSVQPVSYNEPASDVEVICIVRPRNNARGQSESFTLIAPPASLLRQLKQEAAKGASSRQGDPAPRSANSGPANSFPSDLRPPTSIIRAQSNN